MKTIVFFGDSITKYGGYKNGYIDRIQSKLKENSLTDKFKIIGAGESGDKVNDLIQRHEQDVISYKPDVVFIYIGINDVWHFPPALNEEREQVFKRNYQSLLSSIKDKSNAEIIVCTLSVIGERASGNLYDTTIESYCSVIKSLAMENYISVCDLRRSFLNYLHKFNTEDKASGVLTNDGVHLNNLGNELVAESFYSILNSLN